MKRLIYGGSFNPPHRGHVTGARAAREAYPGAPLYLVPDYLPPHKSVAADSPDPDQRLRLTEGLATELPGSEILTLELERGGMSYTSDTLAELQTRWPGDELVFLLGTDMLLTLDSWHEPEKILALAEIGVFARTEEDAPRIAEKKAELETRFGARITVIPSEPVDISSRQLRSLLPLRQGREFLPEAVYAEIIQKRLYGARPDFDWLRERGWSYLKHKRVPHVRGTEQEAVRLALRWGEDPEDAAEAAILHDITKKLSLEEQLRLCETYGIILDAVERTNEKLLHSRTGAAFARDLFGISDRVYDAIRWHTTGHANMTLLEKIIYMADYIEPTRSGFDGLEELRRLSYENLDEAMLLGLRLNRAELLERGTAWHENSAAAERYFEKILAPEAL